MIDSHAHVTADQFDQDRKEVILRAREAGVSWVEIGTDVEQSRKAIALEVPATVGVHPSDVSAGVDWGEIKKLLDSPNVVAVGEVGIDLYHSQNLDEQLEALGKFVDLAREKDLPIVFHVRNGNPPGGGIWDAHSQMIAFLQKHNFENGVIHTFSGTKKQAEQYLEMGLHLSFSGVVTFKNAGEILEVAKTAPLEKILIETDCPFLAPEPFRGKQNEPAYVKYVAEKIAEIRGISFEEVVRATEENTKKLFGLN